MSDLTTAGKEKGKEALEKNFIQDSKKQKIDATLITKVKIFFHSNCIGRNRYATKCTCKKEMLDTFNEDVLCRAAVTTLENYRGNQETSRADNIRKTLKAHHHSSSESLYSLFQRKQQKKVDIRLCINAIAELYSLVLSGEEKKMLKEQLYAHKALELKKTEIKLLAMMASYFAYEKHREQNAMLDWHKLLGKNYVSKETFRKAMLRKTKLRSLAKSFVSVDTSIPPEEQARQTTELLNKIDGKILSLGELHSFAELLRQNTPDKRPANQKTTVGTGIAMTADSAKGLSNFFLEDKDFEPYKKNMTRVFGKSLMIGDSFKLQVMPNTLISNGSAVQMAHQDMDSEQLQAAEGSCWLGFMPLTEYGQLLQVWPERGQPGEVIFICHGTILLVPAETIHGGGFDLWEGDRRAHFYICDQSQGHSLPQVLKNIYFSVEDYPMAETLQGAHEAKEYFCEVLGGVKSVPQQYL